MNRWGIIAVFTFALGGALLAEPYVADLPGVEAVFGKSIPTRAVIVYESGTAVPLTVDQVEVYAKAHTLGVKLWDKDLLGKGKTKLQPDDQAIIDAARGKTLPVLVLQWASGRATVQPCPNLAGLRKAVSK